MYIQGLLLVPSLPSPTSRQAGRQASKKAGRHWRQALEAPFPFLSFLVRAKKGPKELAASVF